MPKLKDRIKEKKNPISSMSKNIENTVNSKVEAILDSKIEKALKGFSKEIESSLMEKIDSKIEKKDFNVDMINKISDNKVDQVLKDIKGDPGKDSVVPGPKGDSIKGNKGDDSVVPGPRGKDSKVPGPKGDTGLPGHTPIVGIDFDIPKPIPGKNADETKIIKKLEKLKRTPEEIARALETLKGFAQLDYFALKNLPDIPKDGKGGKTLHRGGQGLAVFAEDLSSQTGGGNKSFTVPVHTRALLLIGTDFPIIYRPVVDFTTAGVTLTMTGEVDAPTSGATLSLIYAK